MTGRISKEREQYLIRLEGGSLFSVSREVYLCWYGGNRQERYQVERDRKNGVCSLEYLAEIAFGENGGFYADVIASPEESIEEQVIRKMLVDKLYRAIDQLTLEEKKLIQAIFFDDVSMRSYAKEKGVTHRTVQKRRNRILKKLKKLMEGD